MRPVIGIYMELFLNNLRKISQNRDGNKHIMQQLL